jgi:putative methyltransferase (TIGR04325 family)
MATSSATQLSVSSAPQFPSLRSRIRLQQIRAAAALFTTLSNRPETRRLFSSLRRRSWIKRRMDALVGFRRTFVSFAEAQAVAARYIPFGHEHPDEVTFHAAIADVLRESDYPVLFLLAPIANRLSRVFDLGGSVGNLFYAYKSHLTFPASMEWLVFDLPPIRPVGERLAAKRGEHQIHFVDSIDSASGADLFLASGSLHYFEQPLGKILGTLSQLPRHVIVNRTPVSRGPDVITVQDNQSFLVPCKLHSRSTLISGMQSLGYHLHSEWPVHERKLLLPLDPQVSARTYSGFYFKLP